MKNHNNTHDDPLETGEQVDKECSECENTQEGSTEQIKSDSDNGEIESLKLKLDDKSKQCEEYFDKLQRTAAEFDNYKKRTTKEKEGLYSDALSDAVTAFLPVIDSLERAILVADKANDKQSLKEGIELVFRQMKDVMKKLGVEEIKSVGENFDPNLHNAVMHVEDESYSDNTIMEEFQKGYSLKDKVIRHSMVKVAN